MKTVILFPEINNKTEFKYIQGIFFKFKYNVYSSIFKDATDPDTN